MMAATALATTRVSVELPNGRVITLDAESLVQLAAVVSGATTMSEVAATVRQVLGEGAEALSVTQCLTAAVGMIEEGERLKALITSMEAKQHGSA